MVDKGVPLPADADLWRRIAGAASTPEFLRAWLELQCRSLEGVRGGVLVLGEPGGQRFVPVASWPAEVGPGSLVAGAAEQSLRQAKAVVVHGAGDSPDGAARGRSAVAVPVRSASTLHGAVALELVDLADGRAERVLRGLEWGCAWLRGLLADGDGRASGPVPTRPEPAADAPGHGATPDGDGRGPTPPPLDVVVGLLEEHLKGDRFADAARSLAAAIAAAAGCDRVSLGFIDGGQARMVATTAQIRPGADDGLVRAIEAAMDEAADQERAIVLPTANGDVRIDRAHRELAARYGSAAACSWPLRHQGRAVGVITLERSDGVPFDRRAVELCEVLGTVAGPILELERREARPVSEKVAEAFRRRLSGLLGPGHLVAKIVSGAALLVLAVACIVKIEYRVSAPTRIEGSVHRVAAAPFAGFIAEAPLRAGDVVEAGELLCALDDRDLEIERQRLHHQHEQLVKEYHQALAAREASTAKIAECRIGQAKAQLDHIEYQILRSRVTAPLKAIVIAGDLSRSIGAPVQRGEVLFEIAPLGSYRVILDVEERDVAEIAAGQPGGLVLSSFPTEELPIVVEKVTPVSTSGEGRNFFRVEAALEESSPRLRPGMEGIAKVSVGKRRLIWIWSHRVLDWVRLALWRWLP